MEAENSNTDELLESSLEITMSNDVPIKHSSLFKQEQLILSSMSLLIKIYVHITLVLMMYRKCNIGTHKSVTVCTIHIWNVNLYNHVTSR